MMDMIYKMWQYCEWNNGFLLDPPFSTDVTRFGSKRLGDEGYGVETKEYIVISFRGSNDILDWISNLFKVKMNDQGYHSGFYDGVKAMLPDVLKFIQEAGDKPIWFTGHSRGGDVAAIMANEVYVNLDPFKEREVSVVSFGAAKFCSDFSLFDQFVIHGNIDHTIVINGIDPIPSAPWWGNYVRSATRVIRIGKRPTLAERARIWLYLLTGFFCKFGAKYEQAHRSTGYSRAMLEYNGQ